MNSNLWVTPIPTGEEIKRPAVHPQDMYSPWLVRQFHGPLGDKAQLHCHPPKQIITAAEATKEAIWIARFLEELKISCDVYLPVQLYCDNQGAIGLSKNPEDHRRTKRIDIRHHYIREKQEDGTITIHFLPTAEMIADGLTKPLPPVKFK